MDTFLSWEVIMIIPDDDADIVIFLVTIIGIIVIIGVYYYG